MSGSEPIRLRPRHAGRSTSHPPFGTTRRGPHLTTFNRNELDAILAVYARKVAAGEWRDYALEMSRDRAIFSIFRRATEHPLYHIEKNLRLARQGTYSVVAATGLVLKRGPDLRRVLVALEAPRLVDQ